MCLLSFSAGVVVPVTFEEVNRPPDAESGAECDDERLEGSDSAGEECHVNERNRTFCFVVLLLFCFEIYGTGKRCAHIILSFLSSIAGWFQLLSKIIVCESLSK